MRACHHINALERFVRIRNQNPVANDVVSFGWCRYKWILFLFFNLCFSCAARISFETADVQESNFRESASDLEWEKPAVNNAACLGLGKVSHEGPSSVRFWDAGHCTRHRLSCLLPIPRDPAASWDGNSFPPSHALLSGTPPPHPVSSRLRECSMCVCMHEGVNVHVHKGCVLTCVKSRVHECACM